MKWTKTSEENPKQSGAYYVALNLRTMPTQKPLLYYDVLHFSQKHGLWNCFDHSLKPEKNAINNVYAWAQAPEFSEEEHE